MLSVVEWTGGEMVENFTVERGSSTSPPPSTDVVQTADETDELTSPTKKGGAYHTIDLIESSESDYDETNAGTNISVNHAGLTDGNVGIPVISIPDVSMRIPVNGEIPVEMPCIANFYSGIADGNIAIAGGNIGLPGIGLSQVKIDVIEEPACSDSPSADSGNLAEEVKQVVDGMLEFLERRDTFPVFGYDPEGTIENETFVKIEGTCGKPHCLKGCLCSSLRGAFPHGPTHPTHCGFEQCIFKCTCADRNCGALNEDGSRYQDKSKRKKKLPNRYKDTVLGRAYRKVHAKTIQDCETLGNSSSNSEEEYRALSPPDSSKDSSSKTPYYHSYKVPNSVDVPVQQRHSWLPAERGGFTASVKKTIQDRRFAFMRKTLKDEKQTLADVFVWCSQHNKYNCLCINYVYFARTNTLLWRPSKKERYLAIKVMFDIMLTEPSDVVYEVFPFDTSRHSSRTAGVLYDYSARNKDELFLKKRKIEIENNILSYSNGYVKFKKYVIIKQPTPVQMAIPWEDESSEKQESLAPGKNLQIVKTSERMRVDVGEEDLESMVDYDLDEDAPRADDDEAAAKREAELTLSRRKRKMTMKMIQLEEERRREFYDYSDQEDIDEIEAPPFPPPPAAVPVLKKKRGRKPKIRVMMEKAAAAAAVLASSFEVSPVTTIDRKAIEHKNVLNGDRDVRADKVERRLSDSSSERPGLVVRRSSDTSEMRVTIQEPVPEVQLITRHEVRRFELPREANRLVKPDVGAVRPDNVPKTNSEPPQEPRGIDLNLIRLKPSPEKKHVAPEPEQNKLQSVQDGEKRIQKSRTDHQKKMKSVRPRSIAESRRRSAQDGKITTAENKACHLEQKMEPSVKLESPIMEEAIVCAPDLPMRLGLPTSRPLKRKPSQDLDVSQSPAKIPHHPFRSSTPRPRVNSAEKPPPSAVEEDEKCADDRDLIFTKEVRILEPRADGYPHMGLACLTPGLGYVEVLEVLHDRIVIEDPASPGLRHGFANLIAANAWLDGFFRGKATFHPPTLELRWILVMSDILKAKRMAKLDCRMFADPLLIITGQGPARAIPSLRAKSTTPADCSLMRKMLGESPKACQNREPRSKQSEFESYVENPKFEFVRRPSLAVNPKFRNRLAKEMSPEFQSFDSPDGCVTVERIPGSILNSSDESKMSTLASLLNAPKRSSLNLHVQLPEEPMDQAVIKPLPKLTSIRHLPTIPNGHCLTSLKSSDMK
ncbi:Hypothetical protein NTJ_15313 [Nesidiocoris tenuis]|uniref:MGA conserved domain-containing protein n=1 Tax=Nesidiocoris tenuis TaxID=355587 RepID=A0ABN7BFQ7_9HEMI|nr:Hypothetical protein NTJ_15313 [Nesidiocoris tenuis]